MRVTVLGSGAAYARAGGACAGYLFSSGATHVWVDAGNGTFANLQRHVSHRDVDALVLTHGHPDHISDVLPLMYALGFDPEVEPTSIGLYAPKEVGPAIAAPLGGTSLAMFRRVFDLRPIDEPFEVGPLRFTSFRTRHPAETYGLRITDGTSTVAYTSDTAWFDELPDACRDVDILISEATYLDGTEATPGIHMWAREAGELAEQAGAGRLVLTHIWPSFDPDAAVCQAAAVFDGPVSAAAEGEVYEP